MALTVDSKDATPIYAQLERAIRLAIATGQMTPGEQLPTVRQLAVDLRINANTVARVYLALEREGVVETRRGVGTFIIQAAHPERSILERDKQLNTVVDRFITEAASIGVSPREAAKVLARRIKKGESS